jgi:hypothetical protein
VSRHDFYDAISYVMSAMSKGTHFVFYGQQLYGEYGIATVPPASHLPDGAFMLAPRGRWYLVLSGGLTPINYSDIPPEVRLNCLLMGISI